MQKETKAMKEDYKNLIGDGKLPNKYWVFHYDEKFIRKDDEMVSTNDTEETKDSLLGEFRTYIDAIICVNEKAYLSHVVIEDRLTGVVFEQMVIVCPCCGKEDYETMDDIRYTRETMEKKGLVFV
jgi:hypothetical protein